MPNVFWLEENACRLPTPLGMGKMEPTHPSRHRSDLDAAASCTPELIPGTQATKTERCDVSITDTNLHEFNRQDVWAGLVKLVPLSLFVIAFGAAFGLAATQAGLTESSAILMSTLVFAGASQFAALDFWGTQVPIVPLVLTVFAINARHLLMGASL